MRGYTAITRDTAHHLSRRFLYVMRANNVTTFTATGWKQQRVAEAKAISTKEY